MQSSKPLPSFYKRPLPASCISFDSPEGKNLFKAALLEGFLEGYFKLSQSFETQDEPAYCALGTLSMILNALEVDPLRSWRGAWRYYSQAMLECVCPGHG
jgi:glutathione gamma-glutamylcysteinyltransferase